MVALSSRARCLAWTLLAACTSSCAAPDRAALGAGYERVWITQRIGLAVREVGDPYAERALIVPGGSWLDRDLDPLVAALPRVVFYDLAGRSRSTQVADPHERRLDDDVRELEALRRHLGLESFALFGWGYQGAVCVAYALQYPERVTRMILVGPLPARRRPYWDEFVTAFAERTDSDEIARLARLRVSGAKDEDPLGYARATAAVHFATYCADPDSAQLVQSDPCQRPNLDPDRAAELGAAVLAALGDWDWRLELESLAVPTLVVAGREDPHPLEGAREYAEALPEATFVALDGVGHLPWIEAPAAFFPPVLAFLAPAE